jgi:hypothetical protein
MTTSVDLDRHGVVFSDAVIPDRVVGASDSDVVKAANAGLFSRKAECQERSGFKCRRTDPHANDLDSAVAPEKHGLLTGRLIVAVLGGSFELQLGPAMQDPLRQLAKNGRYRAKGWVAIRPQHAVKGLRINAQVFSHRLKSAAGMDKITQRVTGLDVLAISHHF